MKIKFNHPEPKEGEIVGPKYWKSLDALADTPEFKEWLHREFPAGASEIEGVNRRHFLKIMAASFAFAGLGLSGCRSPKHNILPYAKQPENIIPGVPQYYTSSMPRSRDNIPLIVETHVGRPTKIEGNPSYKPYGGATTLITQASILDLYDPDRSQISKRQDGKQLSNAQVVDLLKSVHTEYAGKGDGLAFLATESTSPTRLKIVRDLKKAFPNAIWAEFEPIRCEGADNALRNLSGKSLRARYDYAKAKRIVAIESNFLNSDLYTIGAAREFASGRRVKNTDDAKNMNRLYVAESNLTNTGAMADHRLRLNASDAVGFGYLLAAAIFEKTGASPVIVENLKSRGAGIKIDPKWIDEAANDLVENAGESLVIVGTTMPEELHVLEAVMNWQLKAQGSTVEYFEYDYEPAATIETLANAIEGGKIKTLVILNGNPVYNAPANLSWTQLQKKVPQVIRYGYSEDETSELSHVHIAASHYLESWSDGRTYAGTYVPVQPMIEPLFLTFSEIEVLANLAGYQAPVAYNLVFDTFSSFNKSANQKLSFDQWLAEGLLTGTEYPANKLDLTKETVHKALGKEMPIKKPLSLDNLEVCFVPSTQLLDGRYANNGWLQECPDPITKIAWDNVMSISPCTATELQEKSGIKILANTTLMNEEGQLVAKANDSWRGRQVSPIVELTVNGQTIRGPLNIQPGIADNTIVLTLGYGRTHSGNIGTKVGFSVYPLITSETPAFATGATIKVTNEQAQLANTQEHWSMEGRAIIREANADDYIAHPDFVSKMDVESHSPSVYGPAKDLPTPLKVTEIPRGQSLYQTPSFKAPQQWGMVVDLNSCTGCNACVIACQSENNIAIVGKDQVLRGREMHWMRIDRYFSTGSEDRCTLPVNPQVSFMSVMCQHCELAPCENVCPVNATVHDEQGLNVMAYNRCVGTRYCANNCPYKVRRFNFFDWNKRSIGHFYEGPFGPAGMPELHKMQKNPNVTVRMRGVMEKCTFCVQRIEAAKIHQLAKAKDSGNIKVPEGTIRTACQQVCPTEAIVFGDLADETTAVSQLRNSNRNYSLLGYLNTRPRTTYLAKLRNPNPKMPDYLVQPLSRVEYEERYGHGSNPFHGDPHLIVEPEHHGALPNKH